MKQDETRDLLLFFPFGGNTREALLVAMAQNRIGCKWEILGFIDDNPRLERSCCGFHVLGGREILNLHSDAKVIASPGRPENYWMRQKVIESLNLDNRRWATLIHPTVDLADDVRIGLNTVIMAGCVISTGVSIGDHCVLLPNSVISHESSIGNFSLIGSNVSVSGGTRIGNSCYIGSGSRLIQEIEIGDEALVGIGSVVIHSVPEKNVVAGCPARILRVNKSYV